MATRTGPNTTRRDTPNLHRHADPQLRGERPSRSRDARERTAGAGMRKAAARTRKADLARVVAHQAARNHGTAAAERPNALNRLESRAELREAAAGYAQRGWRVLPLHTVTKGMCSCGTTCSSPGKHPRTRNGLKDATTDLTAIDAW